MYKTKISIKVITAAKGSVIFTIILLFLSMLLPTSLVATGKIILTESGKAKLIISLPANPTIAQQFAASELAKYLHKISGAIFQIKAFEKIPAILLEVKKGKPEEAYSISIKNNNIILSGNSDRAVLYAVYHFLERIGCVWLAPDFSMYNGRNEIVPSNPDLAFRLILK